MDGPDGLRVRPSDAVFVDAFALGLHAHMRVLELGGWEFGDFRDSVMAGRVRDRWVDRVGCNG